MSPMGYNWAKNKMKKYIAVLGLSAFLACGTVFAMNHSSKWNEPKTELNENTEEEVCDVCWEKQDGKDVLGKTQIQVTNNCPYDVTVEFEYWSGSKWITPHYSVKANTVSSWFPADSYRNFKCYKSKYQQQ